MPKTIVLFHSADFDGLFCREIARKFLPDAILIGWDYGQPVEDIRNGINAEDTVYMLDISIDELMSHPNLIWIDHHKSAMEKYDLPLPRSDYEAACIEGPLAARAALPPTNKQLAQDRIILGYRIDGVAACRLAWQWFRKQWHDNRGMITLLPDKTQYIDRLVTEPMAVNLAGEYDIWDKRNPDAELFQHGLRSQTLSESMWEILLTGPTEPQNGQEGLAEITVAALLDAGRSIQYSRTQENESIIKAAGFTIEFEGLKFLACNHARYNSFLFTAGLTPEHDACFGFAYRKGEWHVSLYHAPGKEHHDLSLIAVKYGGGGHKGAAGMRLKTLPFAINS